MGRHEIRLRRKKMTSRRIERHKNYYDVLKKHKRSGFGRRVITIIIYIIIFLGLLGVVYFGVQKIRKAKPIDSQKGALTENTYLDNNKASRPDVFTHVSQNTKSYGKT